jgi:hypothetical protein
MPSIFGIGLSRTGTMSLTVALRMLGYDAIHWPRSMAELEAHDAVTDITVSCRFKELDKKYPGSKFIYTIRDEASWIISCKGHWRRIERIRETPSIPSFAEQAELALYKTLKFNEIELLKAYREHHTSVMEYFKDRPADLLVLNITEEDGWDRLCSFLKKPVPPVEFPHLHFKSG